MLKLSVLDQSPVSEGGSAAEALRQTAALAKETERLGYTRFWVAEHHGATGLAGSSPEVLAAHVAAVTSSIRVGAGGVLLPHYSPYKVAENFRVLEALHPGRIDLGIGRSAGGGALAVRALREHRREETDDFAGQLGDLAAYTQGAAPEGHRFAGLQAAPHADSAPQLWLLGASPGSARLAAERGMGLAYARFIAPQGEAGAIAEYRAHYRPSSAAPHPAVLVALFAVCAETSEEAERLASSSDLAAVLLARDHISSPTPSPESAASYPYTPFDRQLIRENRGHLLVGSPAEIRERLEAISSACRCEEIMIATVTHSFEDKLRSYRLIAEACGLQARPVPQF
ncbi:LLM class flavin-dependent oxidoreductase [Paenibacillus sp. HN-1]|uniref:LLM class flavin-dependent oxidoreductase n=1 Tax=Paenibacillus TaxID=44249 RepID=UPI001CA99C08|nr:MULTISPECIES: LLM class flavin-dependent oxidoreductase [Paenibacillus]MBY9077710.1 LLM class flavin-dependent oxidoreductase [Paenibacillus sp. CGMCC 1.18879]MBY9083711.1 LLM class flavin-dependent oxidoreductase [Paenibacillus sinensis]